MNTTIQLSQETKMALAKLGGKGDTYEDIIKRLIENYDKRTKTTRRNPP